MEHARPRPTRLAALTQQLVDAGNLVRSRSVDIRGCKTVCLALGPYRNLTTLTASVIFLHPHCQVLNHAGDRIFGNRRVDFIAAYDERRFNRFVQYAIFASKGGTRGNHGGSLVHSHAFDGSHPMGALHRSRGGQLLKDDIRCLFWKESLRTSNAIRHSQFDFEQVFARNDRLRFLLPIRNPLDCATSNLKTGHVAIFDHLHRHSSLLDCTRAVLDEIQWFGGLQRRFPDRFFSYFEHEISRDMLTRLASFLRVEPDARWLDDAVAAMELKEGYRYDEDVLRAYEQYVHDNFGDLQTLHAGLLKFLDNGPQ
ncbi:MAG: hypothetical protein ACRD2X_11530 [Vicinamibacteraceae bacterium]